MNENELKYLKLKESTKLNNIEISKKLNLGRSTIFNYQKKYNLNSDFKRIYIDKLSLFETSVLVGTLLGDAWLTRASKTSYRGGFSHKIDNKDYVIYKKELLSKICVDKINYKFSNSGYSVDSKQHFVRFKSSPVLKIIYNKIYKNSKKKINSFVLNHFTDISLALYFQDDGSKLKGKNNWYSYKIAMYDYDYESRLNLSKLLFNKWGIYSSITKVGISISSRSRLKFKTLISPYIVDSMKYKL